MTAERAKQIENELCRAMEESISDPDSSGKENEKYLNAAMAVQELRTYLEWKERKDEHKRHSGHGK